MGREFERKDVAPFLEVDPPHWVARGLSYVLILLFFTAIILTITVRVPETISCSFVLLPVKATDRIRALYDGTILQVRAEEGQLLDKGYPIFTMRSDSVMDRVSEFQSVETRYRGAIESLNNAKRRYEGQIKTDQEEIAGLKRRNEFLARMVQLQQEQLELMKEKVQNMKKLFETGIASQTDYSNEQLEVKKSSVELEGLQREMADNELEIEKIGNEMAIRQVEFEESKHSWSQEIERTQMRMEMLKESLEEPSGKVLPILSPCSGSLLRLHITAPGAVVQDGDPLAEVACTGAALQVELQVPPSDVGRIRDGQHVKLMYDSFPYQRYGVKTGTVRWVAPAATSMGNQSIFRVLVEPLEDSVTIHGQKRSFLPGMGGIAEIVIGRRAVIGYVFEPIRQLRESLK